MASSNTDLERGDPGFPDGHELAPLRTVDSRGPQSTDSASCGQSPATQVSGENLASGPSSATPALNNLQDPSGGPARSVPSTRPSGAPVAGNDASQGQQASPTEPDSFHFAQFCSKYNEKAEKYDDTLIERLRSSADSLLIFAGLFAATVTAFIIESYKTLSPDSGDTALFYLAFISQQLAAASQSTGQANTTAQILAPPPFVASQSSVKVNILWILSLIFSLVSALAATLVQSWLTRYKRLVNQSPQPELRASKRSYYFGGVVQFRLVALAEALPALLHISLFLFLAGLILFLFPINVEVAHVITGVIAAFATLYLGLTITPILAAHAPYRTPFTTIYDVVLRYCIAVISSCISSGGTYHPFDTSEGIWSPLKDLENNRRQTYIRSIGHNYHARIFYEKRTAEARDWLISQLTTTEEAEALVKVLVPVFTCPANMNYKWVKRFLSNQPPMHLRYLLPHIPSILDSCLPPAQAIISCRSDHYDRHRHLHWCQTILLKIAMMLDIKFDILFSTLISLRRLRNDQDAFIASHANMTTILVLAHILGDSFKYGKVDFPSVRMPRDWKFMDMLSWVDSCSNDEFVSRCPVILDALAISLLPPSSSSTLGNRQHNRGTVYLGANDILDMGECDREEDAVIIRPIDHIIMFSLVALSRLLDQLLDHDQLCKLVPPDPNSRLDTELLADMALNTFSKLYFPTGHNFSPSLFQDVERAIVRHTQTIVDQLESESSSGQAVNNRLKQPGLPSMSNLMTELFLVNLTQLVAIKVLDSDARSKGSELYNLFEQR